ncbi:extracellular triacylglycerol lipase precursor [Dendrothele bispora CBS 962.96]|uniref:Extracellular triacylglycerol lipase n=1 Tax=Dendrothele bispora (strain CBS 962.96) TaxID=1314807 RepID=A0A4S8MQ67_DENBC|nr:extracellular triacylglycerol lipase precursor [Dendrothele bispora CBS 962.96]
MLVLRSFPVFLFISSAFAAPQVNLGSTVLTGSQVSPDVEFFGGIPFAEPPVGSLRLRPPVPKFALNVTSFDAAQFGPACLQALKQSADLSLVSEDCLTVNVLRPAGVSENSSLPVIFWTYGGGFTTGTAGGQSGEQIVSQSVARGTPVLHVSFNYRLGALGYPQGQEAADAGALNLGLKDQLTALQWVQQNIGTFGGDKEKVTTMGGSAGSIMSSIQFLGNMTGLARAGIFQSGGAGSAGVFFPQDYQKDWNNFVSNIPQCASVAGTDQTFDCIQSVTNSTLLLEAMIQAIADSGIGSSPFKPTIDGPGGMLSDLPSRLIEQGKFSPVPMIFGDDLDQGAYIVHTKSFFASIFFTHLALTPSPSHIALELSTSVTKLLTMYPDNPAAGSPYGTDQETFGRPPAYKKAASIVGDMSWQSQRRYTSNAFSNAGVNVWGYQFVQRQANIDPALGVPHGSSVTFIYDKQEDTSEDSQNLTRMMVDYWVSFATSLDPNDGLGTGRPNWFSRTSDEQVVMQFQINNATMVPDDYRKEQMDFLNSKPAVWHH